MQHTATDFEITSPESSRSGQDGAEYVRSTEEWVVRCASRMTERWPDVNLESAVAVARELALKDSVRACRPEQVADDIQ